MAVAKRLHKSFTVIATVQQKKCKCLRLQLNLIPVIINARHSICMQCFACLDRESTSHNGAKVYMGSKLHICKRFCLFRLSFNLQKIPPLILRINKVYMANEHNSPAILTARSAQNQNQRLLCVKRPYTSYFQWRFLIFKAAKVLKAKYWDH